MLSSDLYWIKFKNHRFTPQFVCLIIINRYNLFQPPRNWNNLRSMLFGAGAEETTKFRKSHICTNLPHLYSAGESEDVIFINNKVC